MLLEALELPNVLNVGNYSENLQAASESRPHDLNRYHALLSNPCLIY